MLAVVAAAAIALLQPGPAVRPAVYWQVALAVLAFNAIPAAIILPRTWAAVEVNEEGLSVRGRRAVPAAELGTVELLSGMQAYGAGVSTRRRGGRVPSRQNLYAGWADIGPVVAVEHRAPGQSTFWLLPGPRAEELAAALEAVRDRARADRPNDDRGHGNQHRTRRGR